MYNLKEFLNKYGNKSSLHRKVRTDLGGELAKSGKFQAAIRECKFRLETIATERSLMRVLIAYIIL